MNLANSEGIAGRRVELEAESGERLLDAKTEDALSAPGFAAAFDPDEAERMGAFVETAISEEDAIESAADVLTADP